MSINNSVFPLASVADLPANSDLRRVSIVKRSGKVDGKTIERESMVVDLPTSVFSLADDDFNNASLKEFFAFSYSEVIQTLLVGELKSFDRVAQIPEAVHLAISESFSNKSVIFAKIAEYVKAQTAEITRTRAASRITKASIDAFMRTEEIVTVYLAMVAEKQSWDVSNLTEAQKLTFQNYYSKTVIPVVQILTASTAGADSIEKALKAIAFLPECDFKLALQAKAELLLNPPKDEIQDDLGLF